LLWINPNGAVAIWLMNGDQIIEASNDAGTLPDSIKGWGVVDTSFDFNGDGKSDLLWFNPSSGDNAIWLMDGVRIIN
jgi:FG-GAP repeat